MPEEIMFIKRQQISYNRMFFKHMHPQMHKLTLEVIAEYSVLTLDDLTKKPEKIKEYLDTISEDHFCYPKNDTVQNCTNLGVIAFIATYSQNDDIKNKALKMMELWYCYRGKNNVKVSI